MVQENLALEIVDGGRDVEETEEFYGCCINVFAYIHI